MAVTNSGMTLYTGNNTQESWSGSDDLDTEVYIEGSGTESWLVGKNASETATLTLTDDFSGAKYFNFWMKSDWANFYDYIYCELQSSTNNYMAFTAATGTRIAGNSEISGDFRPSVLQIDQGTETGTYSLSGHTVTRINVDASNSGNIRAITNHWIDAMWFGTGRTITGTTTGDAVFEESHALDISGDRYDGCSTENAGIIFFQTDVLVNTTTGNSYSETVVFKDSPNTDGSYTLEVTGTADFQASNYLTESGVTLNLDTSAATSWDMDGGSIVGTGTTAFKSGQDIKNAVFTGRTSFTQSSSNFTNNIVNTSGLFTASSTGTFTGNTFNSGSGAVSVLTAALSYSNDNTFNSDGSNHAVELSSIGAGTMTWDCITTGYETGATGSPVTPTSTGNEDIYVNVGSGTLTINVASGATTPSIRSAGATINVVAGQVTVDFTVSPSVTGYEYAIYTVTALGSLVGASEKEHVETHNSTTFDYTYTYAASTYLAVQVIPKGSNDFEENISYYELASTNQSFTINLQNDSNN